METLVSAVGAVSINCLQVSIVTGNSGRRGFYVHIVTYENVLDQFNALWFIYTEWKQTLKWFSFFDLCLCSMCTLNLILYEPILKSLSYKYKRTFN